MALQLERKARGITGNYWKITKNENNAFTGKTHVELSLYPSETIRREDVNNWLTQVYFYFNGSYTIPESYGKICESVIEQREVTPAVTEGTFPNITIITPAVMEDYESNPFTLAVTLL